MWAQHHNGVFRSVDGGDLADADNDRLIAAMRQPFFKIWGHALGRRADGQAANSAVWQAARVLIPGTARCN